MNKVKAFLLSKKAIWLHVVMVPALLVHFYQTGSVLIYVQCISLILVGVVISFYWKLKASENRLAQLKELNDERRRKLKD